MHEGISTSDRFEREVKTYAVSAILLHPYKPGELILEFYSAKSPEEACGILTLDKQKDSKWAAYSIACVRAKPVP